MSQNKKVKFEYFFIGYKKKEDKDSDLDRPFDLALWIQKLNKQSLASRIRDYYSEKARLDKIEYDEVSGFFIINFTRLRDTNIPMKASVNSSTEPIFLKDDEYMGEAVYSLYDRETNILMLQRNKHGIYPTGIAEYINNTWDNNNEEIYLRPIATGDMIAKAKRGRSYRKLGIRFADLPQKKYKASKYSTFKKIVDSLGDFDAINAEVVITLGHTRKASLKKETIHEVLDEISMNKDIISKAELSQIGTEDPKVEYLDLFSEKEGDYLNVKLESKQSLVLGMIKDAMIQKYIKRKQELKNRIKDRG